MSQQIPSLESLLDAMTPDIHQKLKTAVELGRWESGEKLTEEQRALCLQAVIAYDEAYLSEEQRVGYVKKPAGECGGSNKGNGDRHG